MKKKVEKIWRKINADFDQDESLNAENYSKRKGWQTLDKLESANKSMTKLMQQALDDPKLDEGQFNSKYKIIKQIDSGGQSDIYLAERNDGIYKQMVVIKFISQRYDYKKLQQQFMQEMQLLADLNHPGVVPIIDGNITKIKNNKAQPWLVLEYIDGLHIDTYCIENDLKTDEIVKLTINLCDTLDFVHQRKVLHKDIKPSNVLIKKINDIPYPVLIDFGIAQFTNQHENSELIFGTIGYSAPEQLENKNVDQRTDIYSLGVLLLQLLLGHRFNLSRLEENRINYLKSAEIANDLKQIILRCIIKNPEKRYQSAAALRNDLNNWLMGYPLSFNSHRFFHIFLKSMRRNKWISVLTFSMLFFGAYFVYKYTNDINFQQSLTIKEKNATDELMNYMLDDLYDNLDRIGRIDVLQSIANKSIQHLKNKDLTALDDDGHLQSSKAYINAGKVFEQLQQMDQAQLAYQQAEINVAHLKDLPSYREKYYQIYSHVKLRQSQVINGSNRHSEAESSLLTAIQTFDQLLKINPNSNQEILWESYLNLAYHYIEYSEEQKAQSAINKSLNICQEILSKNSNDPQWLYNYSHSYQLKAWFELDFGTISQGITALNQAIKHGLHAYNLDEADLSKQNNIRILHNQLSFFLSENNDNKESLSVIKTAIEHGLQLQLKAPFNQKFQRELSYSYSTIGDIYQQQDNFFEALAFFEKSLIISRNNYSIDSKNHSLANDLAIDLMLVAGIYEKNTEHTKSKELVLEANKIITDIYQTEPNNKYYTHTFVVSLLMLGKLDEAKELLKKLEEIGMVDEVIKALLDKYHLNDWLKE